MARPQKLTVEYFPHQCNHGKSIFVLEKRYGNDGYAFWFKLLEQLGNKAGHFLDLSEDTELEFVAAKANLDAIRCGEILDLLAGMGSIDSDLWTKKRIVWSENFISGIADVYRKRRMNPPQKPELDGVSAPETQENGGLSGINGVSASEMQQSKLKETKENKSTPVPPAQSEPKSSESAAPQPAGTEAAWDQATREYRSAFKEELKFPFTGTRNKLVEHCSEVGKSPMEALARINQLVTGGVRDVRPWLLFVDSQVTQLDPREDPKDPMYIPNAAETKAYLERMERGEY